MFKSNFKLNPLFELGLRPSSFSLTAKNCLSFSAVEVSGCHFSAPALKCSKQDSSSGTTARTDLEFAALDWARLPCAGLVSLGKDHRGGKAMPPLEE